MKDTREWLQKEFEYFEAEPPVDLWPEIEARMEQEKSGKKKWIPYFSIAASILVLFGIFWTMRLVDRGTSSTMIAKDQKVETAPAPKLKSPAVMDKTEIAEAPEQNEKIVDEAMVKEDFSKKEAQNTKVPTNTIERHTVDPTQLIAVKEHIGNEQKEDISLQLTEETEKRTYILSNINQPNNTVAIRTANNYEDHILNEVDMMPTRAPERIERVGSTNKLDLNDLTLEHAVAFATTGLNKIVNTPLEITQKDAGGETVKTYSFRLGNFTITKKQHVKTIKTDRS